MRELKCANGTRVQTFEEQGVTRLSVTDARDGRWTSFDFGVGLTDGEKEVIREMLEDILDNA